MGRQAARHPCGRGITLCFSGCLWECQLSCPLRTERLSFYACAADFPYLSVPNRRTAESRLPEPNREYRTVRSCAGSLETLWPVACRRAAGCRRVSLYRRESPLALGCTAQFYLHFYPDLARLLRDFQPDIIDLWEEPWSLVSAQADPAA